MCNLKTVLWINLAVFSLVGLFHLLRLVFQWEFQIGSRSVPLLGSIPAVFIIGVIIYLNVRHLLKK